MDYAVIKTGGKQYLVTTGSKVKVEKLDTEAGKKITFTEVLLTVIGDAVTVGTPAVKGAKVEGLLLRHARHDKVTGVKMKAKKRRKKYFGHKQHFSEVEIQKIKA